MQFCVFRSLLGPMATGHLLHSDGESGPIDDGGGGGGGGVGSGQVGGGVLDV